MRNVCIVAGARPDFVKVAPLIRVLSQTGGIRHRLVFTGTKNTALRESSLFNDLQITAPDACLGVECSNLNELTGRVMNAFDSYLEANATDIVIVVNDLAATMAVAIVTKKRGIRLASLVAGTRSFDINMPKEINRLVIDGLSDILFTAGISNNSIANREGASLSKVFLVGNILIDNLRFIHQHLQRPPVMDELKISEGAYIVLTLNRKAIISDNEKLALLIDGILTAAGDVPVVAPLRDEARKAVESIGKGLTPTGMMIVPPIGYADFCYVTANASGIVTDSGNVAEEATFNGVPCITLNNYAEHIETVKTGSNVLVGEDADLLKAAVGNIVRGEWKQSALPDKWDGRTAERIVRILQNTDM